MTISGIDPTAAQPVTNPRDGQMQQVLQSVSSLLGMDQSDVRSALRGGQSLSDLASQKGISSDKLTAAITSALQSSGTALPAGTDVSQLAQKIADHKRGGHHHGHHQQAAAQQPATQPLADPSQQPTDGSTIDVLG